MTRAEKAKTFLLKLNPGVRNINGQLIVMMTEEAWLSLIALLDGNEDYGRQE